MSERNEKFYREESLAPKVDFELLRCLVECELSRREMRLPLLLISCFKSWNDAYVEVLIESFRETYAKQPRWKRMADRIHGYIGDPLWRLEDWYSRRILKRELPPDEWDSPQQMVDWIMSNKGR